MLDLNRYYPPKYYIGDVYLAYLAEKKNNNNRPAKGLFEPRMNESLSILYYGIPCGITLRNLPVSLLQQQRLNFV